MIVSTWNSGIAKDHEELRRLEASIKRSGQSYGLNAGGVVYVKASTFCIEIYPDKHGTMKGVFSLDSPMQNFSSQAPHSLFLISTASGSRLTLKHGK